MAAPQYNPVRRASRAGEREAARSLKPSSYLMAAWSTTTESSISSDTAFEGGTANKFVLGRYVIIHGALVRGELDAQLVVFKENVQIVSNVVDRPSSPYSRLGGSAWSFHRNRRSSPH